MATYIHYERFCSSCRRYFEGKIKECPKCNGTVKNVNKWYVTFRAEEFGQTKQKKLGAFTTKNEAEQAYMQYSVGEKAPTSSYTFEMLALEVLEVKKQENKSSSYMHFKNIYFNRLSPLLQYKVKNIEEKDLRHIRQTLIDSTYSDVTQETTWQALGAILRFASIHHNISTPYKNYLKIKPITAKKKKKTSWTKEEWHKFINTVYEEVLKAKQDKDWQKNKYACKHYIFYVLFNFMMFMGNRIGEVTAIKIKKINFKDNIIIIDENITYKLLPEERKKGLTYTTTDRKNHKTLYATIPKTFVPILKEYIKTFQLKDNDYLFFKNAPLEPKQISRALDSYISLAGVSRITPHQFRHTLASFVFASGNSKIEDAYVVANRLGHNVKYTLDTYGSLFKDREREILDNLDI